MPCMLGDDATAWAQYTAFFTQSAAHARQLWPHTPVGVKLTFAGAQRAAALIRPL